MGARNEREAKALMKNWNNREIGVATCKSVSGNEERISCMRLSKRRCPSGGNTGTGCGVTTLGG